MHSPLLCPQVLPDPSADTTGRLLEIGTVDIPVKCVDTAEWPLDKVQSRLRPFGAWCLGSRCGAVRPRGESPFAHL